MLRDYNIAYSVFVWEKGLVIGVGSNKFFHGNTQDL